MTIGPLTPRNAYLWRLINDPLPELKLSELKAELERIKS